MEQGVNASFKLLTYSVVDFLYKNPDSQTDIEGSGGVSVSFIPNGLFNLETGVYSLSLMCVIFIKESNTEIAKANLIADFQLQGVTKVEDIQPYFYANSIAIVFPYLRAFISTLTLQANVTPIILPTLNLTDLANPLKQNTVTNIQVMEMDKKMKDSKEADKS